MEKSKQDLSTLTPHPLYQIEKPLCSAVSVKTENEIEIAKINERLLRIAEANPHRRCPFFSPELRKKRRKMKKEAKLAKKKSRLIFMADGEWKSRIKLEGK
ncbi:MAG: hypothetical protein ACOX4U_02875 [Anaerovoracaceae bacterium]|jgi:hypothetical protein